MIFGSSFFITWIIFMSKFSNNDSITYIKNMFLLSGILFVLAILEIVWELKKGFKFIFRFVFKSIFKFFFKSIKKIRLNKIKSKIMRGMLISRKEQDYWRENQDEKK